MTVEGMISEAIAVKEAGVSARTLQRFSEAGYLTVQVKGDGERLYFRPQLVEIFGSFQEPIPSIVASTSAGSGGGGKCFPSTSSMSSFCA